MPFGAPLHVSRGPPPIEGARYTDAAILKQGGREQAHTPAPASYSTATASTSIRNSGCASAATATSVWAGIFLPKNSSRIGP